MNLAGGVYAAGLWGLEYRVSELSVPTLLIVLAPAVGLSDAAMGGGGSDDEKTLTCH